MLRILSLIACLLYSFTCFANDYILATGEGFTVEQARENAFRQAIQIKVGTIVLSEREAAMGKLKRDGISVYSAGYVTDYKTVSVNDSGKNIIVVLNVLVKESKLLNQVLSTGKTIKDIDGDNSFTKFSTYINQKEQADKLISSVMTTYPKNAYILNQGTHKILIDSYRNAVIEIPYSLKWNFDFIRAVNEAMSLVQDSQYGWIDAAPSNVKTGHRTHFKFNDMILLDKIKAQFTYDRLMRMKLVIQDNNLNILYQLCYDPGYRSGRFFALGEPSELRIFDLMKDEGVIRITMKSDVIQRAARLELSVAADSECQKI